MHWSLLTWWPILSEDERRSRTLEGDLSMTKPDRRDTTQILAGLKAETGPGQETANRLFAAVFGELRHLAGDLMRRERTDHTLQATALVNEAYLRLVDDSKIDWRNRAHFFGIAARAMREILVDHARGRAAAKRGGGLQRVSLNDAVGFAAEHGVEILDLERVLTELGEMDERMARVVEMRVFAGLKVEEVAHVLGVSVRTIHNDWRVAKMWLARQLSEGRSL
jgi:RNA polymerase sigma-70 factor (ECF subfamily)